MPACLFVGMLLLIFNYNRKKFTMESQTLLNNIYALLKEDLFSKEDFRIRINGKLQAYKTLISQFRNESYLITNSDINNIKAICKKIKMIVESCLLGQPSRAFSQLHNLFTNNKRGPYIDISKRLTEIRNGKSFYRLRVVDSIYKKTIEEMFHNPLDKRGEIKTQRFSSPGYPCLYLGESIYGCWEEMRRPDLTHCAVSRFQNFQNLRFLDLTMPTIKELEDINILFLIPLIIAVMMPVKNYNDTYKPEYSLPQLIFEWVLKNRGKYNLIHGIRYTSSHLNDEFEFAPGKFVNYAVPVFYPLRDKKYCSELMKLFQLTKPTSNTIEKLKGKFQLNWYKYEETDCYEEIWDKNYEMSDFGNLEWVISDIKHFPLQQISTK